MTTPKQLDDFLKFGARNSANDAARLQTIHDLAVENGAKCGDGEMPKSLLADDTVIMWGSEVKAIGNGRVGGYLLRYSGAGDPDLTGDFFNAETYTGKAEMLDVYYQHGLDPHMGKRVIGEAKARRDDVGLWVEAQLSLRDEYEKQIYKLAEAGKLGWSSGAVSHLVERKSVGSAYHVTNWPIAEASLTPTPAEPRNSAISLKSLLTNANGNQAGQPTPDGASREQKQPTTLGANHMDAPNQFTLPADIKATIEWAERQRAEQQDALKRAEIRKEVQKEMEIEMKAALARAGLNPDNPPPHTAPTGGEIGNLKALRARPEYAAHFTKMLQGARGVPAEFKALSEGTDTAGGFLAVPPQYDQELEKKRMGLTALYNLVRKVNTTITPYVKLIRTYTTDNIYTAGARLTKTGEIPASATAARVTSNTYGQKVIPDTTYMMTELVYNNLLEDSMIVDVEADLRETFVEADLLGKEYYLASGAGGGEPEGLFVNSTLQTNYVASGAAAALTADGLKNLIMGVPAQYRQANTTAMVFNTNTLLAISKLKDGNGRYLLENSQGPGFGGGLSTPLPGVASGYVLGVPYYISEFAPDISAGTYPIIFGDFSGYTFTNRLPGAGIMRLNELYAETNAVAFVYRTRFGGGLVAPWKFRLLKVAAS